MAAGIPNALYWTLTPAEVVAVVREVALRERAANLRAGLIAATLMNIHRKKGSRLIQPGDFLRRPREYMTVEAAQEFMHSWAKDMNQKHALASGNGDADPPREESNTVA